MSSLYKFALALALALVLAGGPKGRVIVMPTDDPEADHGQPLGHDRDLDHHTESENLEEAGASMHSVHYFIFLSGDDSWCGVQRSTQLQLGATYQRSNNLPSKPVLLTRANN